VTVLYPGYIISEMSARSETSFLMSSTEKGVSSMVNAIEKEKASARVLGWPWEPLGFAMKHLPFPLARKLLR
ncbi:MAG TPA: short chain dehydrogenase, partial [Nocardioidaceae bacterium]|nr:short chain dehydrogenase [Nocardioidaceae bacterium]